MTLINIHIITQYFNIQIYKKSEEKNMFAIDKKNHKKISHIDMKRGKRRKKKKGQISNTATDTVWCAYTFYAVKKFFFSFRWLFGLMFCRRREKKKREFKIKRERDIYVGI